MNQNKMESKQQIQDAIAAIIAFANSYTLIKERKQIEQQKSQIISSLVDISYSLLLLWNNLRTNINILKSITDIQKLLHSLFKLSCYQINTHFNKEYDQQTFTIRNKSRNCLYGINYYGDAQLQADLVNIKYDKILVISISTASGSGEIQDEEISNGLRYISMFLRELYQGRNLQPSFPPLPLLAHRSQEQIEEEGGNEELESQMINKGSNNWRQSIMDITNMAKAAILNYFVDQSNLEPF